NREGRSQESVLRQSDVRGGYDNELGIPTNSQNLPQASRTNRRVLNSPRVIRYAKSVGILESLGRTLCKRKRPRGDQYPGGSIRETIIGNDQILCGNVASTFYLITLTTRMGHTDLESTMRYLKPNRSPAERKKVNRIFA